MNYHYSPRPTARRQALSDSREGSHRVTSRELPKKLTVWQVIGVWLAVVMLLPFLIFLLGMISSLIGVEDVIPPQVFYRMAQFALLLAIIFSSALAVGSGLLYVAVQRPTGDHLRFVLVLLSVVSVLGFFGFYSLIHF